MGRDRLFLLKPGFTDGSGGSFYCPACAEVGGLLSYYPELLEKLEVSYIDFPRPRPEIVAEIGEANQDAPVLILDGKPEGRTTGYRIREYQDRFFVSGPRDIGNYLADRFGVARPPS